MYTGAASRQWTRVFICTRSQMDSGPHVSTWDMGCVCMFALAGSECTVLPWATAGGGKRSYVGKCRSPGMAHINDHSHLLKFHLCSLNFNHFTSWPPLPSSQLCQLIFTVPVLDYPITSLLSSDLSYVILLIKLPITLDSMIHPFTHSPASIINSLTLLSHWPSMDDSINKVTREWWLMRHSRITKDKRCHYNLNQVTGYKLICCRENKCKTMLESNKKGFTNVWIK